jgi:hypothetical protein
MNLETLCDEFLAARGKDGAAIVRILKSARDCLRTATESDWAWLRHALLDSRQKWFVAAIFSKHSLPRRLFSPMIAAAVHEINPSLNKQFVLPCVASYDHRKVNESLLEIFETGSNFEKAGAANALYWAQVPLSFPPDAKEFTPQNAKPQWRTAYLELDDIWNRRRCLYLKEFVTNEDIDVRRSIIPSLNLDPANYPVELRPLVSEAIKIARAHPDDYIRHRVEVQLGECKLLLPLPHRAVDPG